LNLIRFLSAQLSSLSTRIYRDIATNAQRCAEAY